MKVIKRTNVLKIVEMSNSTMIRLINEKKFPSPIKLSPNRVGWIEEEIYKWIEERQQTSLTK